jgi:hypothetical protein
MAARRFGGNIYAGSRKRRRARPCGRRSGTRQHPGRQFIIKASFLKHVNDEPRFGNEPTFSMPLTTEDLAATLDRQHHEEYECVIIHCSLLSAVIPTKPARNERARGGICPRLLLP